MTIDTVIAKNTKTVADGTAITVTGSVEAVADGTDDAEAVADGTDDAEVVADGTAILTTDDEVVADETAISTTDDAEIIPIVPVLCALILIGYHNTMQ